MALWVVKVKSQKNMFRIFIPMEIIRKHMWNDTEYVLIDDSQEGKLVIRRLLDREYLKGRSKENKS